MKKYCKFNKIPSVITLLLGLVPLAPVQANDYVRAIATLSSMEKVDDGIAAGVGWGRTLYHVLPHFGVEGEIIKSFSNLEQKQTENTLKRSFTKAGFYGTLTYPLNLRWLIKGKLGFQYSSIKNRLINTAGTTTNSSNSTDTGMDFGIGAIIRLDRRKDVTIEYITNDTNDFSHVLLALQFNY
jgi:hypothetical protein